MQGSPGSWARCIETGCSCDGATGSGGVETHRHRGIAAADRAYP
jgi:hypothetical protein